MFIKFFFIVSTQNKHHKSSAPSRRLVRGADQCSLALSVSSSRPKWAAGMHDLFDFPEKPGLPLVSPHTSSNKALFVCALREMNVLTVSQNVSHLSTYTSQKVKQDGRKVLTCGGVGLFCILIYANVHVIDWNQCIRICGQPFLSKFNPARWGSETFPATIWQKQARVHTRNSQPTDNLELAINLTCISFVRVR